MLSLAIYLQVNISELRNAFSLDVIAGFSTYSDSAHRSKLISQSISSLNKQISSAKKQIEELKKIENGHTSEDLETIARHRLTMVKPNEIVYIDIYKKYAIDDSTSDKEDISKTLNQLKDILDKEEAVIDFLIKNKNSWKLEDDTLVFYSKTLSDQYDKLTGELNNI